MRNVRVQLAAAALFVCFGTSLALGCVFEFPWQLLNNRAATLDTMPVHNSFIFAAAHLVPPSKDDLHAVESQTDSTNEEQPSDAEPVDALTKAEDAGLSSDQAETVRQMRAETNGDSAFDKGALLPASVRLYTAGAVDFHKGNTTKAIARFRRILDLPPDDKRDREVWAAYMLGRLYSRKGEVEKASRSFALTRNFVNEGAPDPLGLAVASYGEEARVHLGRARALKKSKKLSAKQHRDYGQEIASAVGLYAEQAAHGSGSGIDSLRIVAYEVLGDEAAIEASICDPIVRQLLVDRLLTDNASPPEDGYSGDNPNSQLAQVVSATQKCGEDHLANADQLAAIAYRSGDYHLAQRVVAQSTGPLASWVRARLAMQQGNNAEAARYYAEASKAFPASIDPHSADAGTRALLVGQNSVLTLSRGEYIDALEQLYPYAATFWGDVAYIAERVLTVDELKTFVDTHNDTQAQPEISLANLPEPVGSYASDYGSNDAPNPFGFGDGRGPTAHLRDLLARRLVRAHRYQEALEYIPAQLAAASTSSPEPTPTPALGMGIRLSAVFRANSGQPNSS